MKFDPWKEKQKEVGNTKSEMYFCHERRMCAIFIYLSFGEKIVKL